MQRTHCCFKENWHLSNLVDKLVTHNNVDTWIAYVETIYDTLKDRDYFYIHEYVRVTNNEKVHRPIVRAC